MSLALFQGRLANLRRRIVAALHFFPFTVLHLLIHAARKSGGTARTAAAADAGDALPLRTLAWLARLSASGAPQPIDIQLRLPREGEGIGVRDALSAMLTFARVRSIELSWDDRVSATLTDELPEQSLPAHAFEVPVAAEREAQTLLKRLAGGAAVILVHLREPFAAARSDLYFFQLDAAWGFTLHERMALVRAADAYIGASDTLGGTAQLSGRPALLVSGTPGTSEVAAFLDRHFGAAASSTPARSSTSPGS